ncbi:unknown [Bacteroides sp. CAG:1060]|nr:unknown [Bacteroides sp. CAG:1060]
MFPDIPNSNTASGHLEDIASARLRLSVSKDEASVHLKYTEASFMA